jgi:hypothetical protein
MTFLAQQLSILLSKAPLSNLILETSSQSKLPSKFLYLEDKYNSFIAGNTMPSNLSIHWIIASSIAVWFLFIHSPPFLIKRNVLSDFPFATHMFGAYTIYLSCMFNTLFTPSSLRGKARPFHIWIGRIGMISGIVSFVFGFYCAWWPSRLTRPPLGFSIGITIGGLAQIVTQYVGYVAIQKYQKITTKLKEMDASNIQENEVEKMKQQSQGALRTHVYNMVFLFVAACGIPAGLRIADMLPASWGIARTIGIIILFELMGKAFGDSYFKSKPILADATKAKKSN